MQVCICSAVKVIRCECKEVRSSATVLVCRCDNVWVCICSAVKITRCEGDQVFRFATLQVCICVAMQVSSCAGVQVCFITWSMCQAMCR